MILRIGGGSGGLGRTRRALDFFDRLLRFAKSRLSFLELRRCIAIVDLDQQLTGPYAVALACADGDYATQDPRRKHCGGRGSNAADRFVVIID